MTGLPAPTVTRHDGVLVVRDDRIPGGTKRRGLPTLLAGAADEVVYASPAYGYAQVALAHEAAAQDRQATVFVAARKTPHPRTAEARAAGAKIVHVPAGRLNVVTARARAYARQVGATLLPFGFDTPGMVDALAAAAADVPLDDEPDEVWTVAGSGTLTRALQKAWPGARFHAVQVGRPPDAGRAAVHTAPEPFDKPARQAPPFPSCDNYDAKAWRFIRDRAAPGAVFWNVAA